MPPNPRLAQSGNRPNNVPINDGTQDAALESKSGQDKNSGDLQEKNQRNNGPSSFQQNNTGRFGQQRSPYNNSQYGLNSGAYGMSGYGNSMGGLGGYGMMGMGGYGMGYGMSGYGMSHGGGIMGLVTALYSVNHILMSFGQLVQIIGGNSQQIMMQLTNIRQFIVDLIHTLRNPAMERWIKSSFRRYKLLRWVLVIASMAITAQVTRMIRTHILNNYKGNIFSVAKGLFATILGLDQQEQQSIHGRIPSSHYLTSSSSANIINDVSGIEMEPSWEL